KWAYRFPFAKERTMSLATYLSSNKSKAFESRLHGILAAVGRRCIDVFEAIAEARVQRGMIEPRCTSTGANTPPRTTTTFRYFDEQPRKEFRGDYAEDQAPSGFSGARSRAHVRATIQYQGQAATAQKTRD